MLTVLLTLMPLLLLMHSLMPLRRSVGFPLGFGVEVRWRCVTGGALRTTVS